MQNKKLISLVLTGTMITVLASTGIADAKSAKCVENNLLLAKNNENQNGWINKDNVWSYYKEGVPQTGWQDISGSWYYFNNSGTMQTGWQEINNTWYYFQKTGAMVTGWLKNDGEVYHMSKSGSMDKGWTEIQGDWHYFNKSGAMVKGWQEINNKWYYLDQDGVMQKGWIKENGNSYYLDNSGAMVTGLQKIDGKEYVFNDLGVMQTAGINTFIEDDIDFPTGWIEVNNQLKYFSPYCSGKMIRGQWADINGNWYLFNSNGDPQTGFIKDSTYQPSWYYLNKAGKMQEGWNEIGRIWYYMGENGQWNPNKVYNGEPKTSKDVQMNNQVIEALTQQNGIISTGVNQIAFGTSTSRPLNKNTIIMSCINPLFLKGKSTVELTATGNDTFNAIEYLNGKKVATYDNFIVTRNLQGVLEATGSYKNLISNKIQTITFKSNATPINII
ncbi:MAG: hypothetical protein ACRCX8_13425 [Sarcina sp.]